MNTKTFLPRARKAGTLTALAAALTLTATSCSANSTGTGAAPATATASARQDTPYGHVHGMAIDSAGNRVLLATHHGLFEIGSGIPKKIGPTIDLMGFSVAGPGHFYASGHPGADSDLPDPAGLIQSDDGGNTWKPLSRQGESDFHALTVTRDGVLGFDGTLRSTTDLRSWTASGADVQPHSLAGTPTSSVALATTEQGLRRSTDGGKTWTLKSGAPVLLVATFADDSTAVGVAPDGTVHISTDAGTTWKSIGSVSGPPAAVAAAPGDAGRPHIWVYTDNGLEHSTDGGKNFTAAGQ